MVDRLGWTLLHSVWEGFLVALVVGVLLRAMRGASSGVRYGVASLGFSACMVMVVAGTFFVSGSSEGRERAGAAPSCAEPRRGLRGGREPQGRTEEQSDGRREGCAGGVVGRGWARRCRCG